MKIKSNLFKKLPDKALNQFYGGETEGTKANTGTEDVQETSTTHDQCPKGTDTKTTASGDGNESECTQYKCP